MNIEKALKLCFATFVGSILGLLASTLCIVWVYIMAFVSLSDIFYISRLNPPPKIVFDWFFLDWVEILGDLGPIINFIFIGIISGLVGGIIFHLRDQTTKNARLGGFFGTLIGSGVFTFLLSILLFINAGYIIILFVGISLLYLIVVVLIAGYFYKRSG